MKCPQCNDVIIWEEEFEYDQYGIEGDGIIGVYYCENEECTIDDIYLFTPLNATL